MLPEAGIGYHERRVTEKHLGAGQVTDVALPCNLDEQQKLSYACNFHVTAMVEACEFATLAVAHANRPRNIRGPTYRVLNKALQRKRWHLPSYTFT
jgi:hypothetical protein